MPHEVWYQLADLREATKGQRVSGRTRGELLKVVGERYRRGTRDEKRRIFDEFAAVTGYHRKHAIRLFKARWSRAA